MEKAPREEAKKKRKESSNRIGKSSKSLVIKNNPIEAQ
jgi:hypothetical protein